MSCPCRKCRPLISDEAWQTVQGVSISVFLFAVAVLVLRAWAPVVELP